jgi:protein AbiQ
MKFYTVDDDYISYLRKHDETVFKNKVRRPYIGVVLEINECKYLAPLSSQDKQHKNLTIFRIYEKGNNKNKLGVLHLNNMIPILDTVITEVKFKEQEIKYRSLLEKQFKYIKSEQDTIKNQAKKLYEHVINKDKFYTAISCNFICLESIYKNFNL